MTRLLSGVAAALLVLAAAHPVAAQGAHTVRTGQAAFGDWRSDAPGVRRKITPADLPRIYAERSASNDASIVRRPRDAQLQVPAGFAVQQIASGLDEPRIVRVAPNGDIFIAESRADRVRVLRVPDGAEAPAGNEVFAIGLRQPFGIAFYPPGPEPRWVYVANTDSVVRFPYAAGDLKARGAAEVVVAEIPGGGRLHGGGHWTRDIAFSADGARMFVSVGSRSNVFEHAPKPPADLHAHEARYGLGAAWDDETRRADVLVYSPEPGQAGRTYATGLRNCVGLAVHPATGDVWCSTNERDGLGDNLPPDYITRVREGGFYGWPWYYIGANEDPRHKGARPDLRDRVTVPDVLLQPHSASLGMTFYTGAQFPAEMNGESFAAFHGSWNRATRTGYKIVRVRLKDGLPTGEYEDFVTGFVTADGNVWGRPVGVAVAHDGALLFTEDANGTLWRVSWRGGVGR